MERHTIASDHLQAAIKTHGAELCQLRTAEGHELLWPGDPAQWARQAPNLFPVVGGLQDGVLVHQGRTYPMAKHGFARDRAWTLTRLSGHACTLRLRDDGDTRASYPFPFSLSLTARIDGNELSMRYELHNPGEEPLLASLGAHPALRWPILPGLPRESHRLEFEKHESEAIAGLDGDGLIIAHSRPSPLEGRHLPLRDELFTRDALLFPMVRSHTVRYCAPGAPVLEMTWDGFPQFAVWTRPGAGFLCLEPWRGLPSPAGFRGEFADKPGVFSLGPGATASASYTLRVLSPEY